MNEELKKLGIVFEEPELIETYYSSLKGIFVAGLSTPDQQGMILDLNSLPAGPIDFKGAVIRWLISVNLPRIKQGQDPIFPISLVRMCPVWRVVRMPIRVIKLTKEGSFNKPSIKTASKKTKAGSINN